MLVLLLKRSQKVNRAQIQYLMMKCLQNWHPCALPEAVVINQRHFCCENFRPSVTVCETKSSYSIYARELFHSHSFPHSREIVFRKEKLRWKTKIFTLEALADSQLNQKQRLQKIFISHSRFLGRRLMPSRRIYIFALAENSCALKVFPMTETLIVSCSSRLQ